MSAYVPGLTADRGNASEGPERRGAITDDAGADPVSLTAYGRQVRRGTFVPSTAVPICWSRVKAQGKTGRVGIQLKATERAGDVKTLGVLLSTVRCRPKTQRKDQRIRALDETCTETGLGDKIC